MTFQDIAVTPSTAARTVSFVATDGSINSIAATRTVTVAPSTRRRRSRRAPARRPPTATAAASPVDATLTVGDRDSATLPSAAVAITGNFRLGDTLSFTNNGTTMGDIAGSYDAVGGVLTLTSAGGAATLAQWQRRRAGGRLLELEHELLGPHRLLHHDRRHEHERRGDPRRLAGQPGTRW